MQTIISDYRVKAQQAFSKYYQSEYRAKPTEIDAKHICDIATLIMMTRDKHIKGGGFATAVVNNDLEGAIERADSVCSQHLPFFVYCKKFI